MKRVSPFRVAGAVAVAAALLALPEGAGAQERVVRGLVVDAATGLPVPDADILLHGPVATRTVSDSMGRWRLAVPAAGEVRIRARRLGYAAADIAVGGLESTTAAVPVTVRLVPLPIPLEAVVVTAARREQRLKDAVVETELLTRHDLERSGAADLAAVLSSATGIQLEGGVPAGSGVLLQGLGARRVLVLLDGQPVVGRVNGNLDVSRLPVSMIERVEVVRGPQSTLYGSEAMGGVVNILTRRPERGRMERAASLTAGSHGRREVGASARGFAGEVGMALDAGYRTVDLAPGVPGDAGTLASRWHVAPRLDWRAGARLSVEAAALVVGERQRYRTGQLFNFGDNTQVNARFGASWDGDGSRFAPVLSWSRFDHLSRASTASQPASDSGARDVQELVQADLALTMPFAGATVDGGVTLRRDAITAGRVSGGTRVIHTAEPYAQATWSVGGLHLTPGARVSASERWGTVVTPRLAVLYRPSGGVAFRAAVGRGYRAPDFKELYLEFVNAAAGYAVRGNPDLRPETSTSVSFGVEAVGSRLFGRASAFTNRYRDFIETGVPDVSNTYSYGNVAGGTTRGLDVEAGWMSGAARVEAAWSFLRAREAGSGAPLLGRPERSGRVSASVQVIEWLRLGTTFLYTGSAPIRRDATGAVSASREGFGRMDFRAAVSLPMSLELTIGADNLLDRRVVGWPGFTGRQAYAGLRWRHGS